MSHNMGRRTPPISYSCQWCSTRLLLCNRFLDFCRSCARQRWRKCVCEASVLTTSDNLVQKLSLLRFPRNLGQINHPRPHSDSLVKKVLFENIDNSTDYTNEVHRGVQNFNPGNMLI